MSTTTEVDELHQLIADLRVCDIVGVEVRRLPGSAARRERRRTHFQRHHRLNIDIEELRN
jgi:hypothetical protein